MKQLLLYSLVAIVAAASIPAAEAKPKHHKHKHKYKHRHERKYHDHDHDRHSRRTRTLYFIENHRPVRRVVYVNPGGGYYRLIGGRRVIVRERYFTSYPSRYYYPDGRRRVGITLSF